MELSVTQSKQLTANPAVPWAGISRVFQILANRPRENTSKRVIVNLEVYLWGNLLLYIY